MKKKGLSTMSTIAMILILLIILIILVVVATKIIDIQKETMYNNKCKQSVREFAALKLANTQMIDMEIDCPTRNVTLKGDTEDLKYQLAMEMYRCWDNYGRGELNLFTAKDQRFCAYCSYVQFDDPNLVLYNFTNYLLNTETPDGRATFYEFISSVQTSPEVLDEAKTKAGGDLYTHNDYAIMYTHYTQGEWSKTKEKVLTAGKIIAFGATAVFGAVVVVTTGWTGAGAAAGIALVAIGVAYAHDEFAASSSGDEQEWDAAVQMVVVQNISILGCEYLPVKAVR